ncbi:hypothetical protein T11_10703 [Trichinella zimbabwensis]|uniref:Uncharacterized protein n=1 Tax=Trichinella zimbabwensis TaxID=268475 RepID=A0A0V1GDU6_9BILA|nr:hypothetical protein T11_10703 [Trichinella zimbabwensis]
MDTTPVAILIYFHMITKQCLRARKILSNSRIPEPFGIPF